MMNDSIQAQSAGVLALLADTSRAGYGGEGYYSHGNFGELNANAVRTDAVLDDVNRNGEDAHFFALGSEERKHFDILNGQSQSDQLAEQAQISQLALQLCRCCNDRKASLGVIEGKLECLGKEAALEILIANANQDCEDLLGQIAVSQNGANMAQSNAQHIQILSTLGQIAGALAAMDDDGNGSGGGRRRRRRCRCECECECECNGDGDGGGDGITIRNIAISGNGNGPRGGGGIVEDIEDDEETDGGDDGDPGGDNGDGPIAEPVVESEPVVEEPVIGPIAEPIAESVVETETVNRLDPQVVNGRTPALVSGM